VIRIALTQAAATLPLSSGGSEAERTGKGEVFIWLEDRWLDKLAAMRGPGARLYRSLLMWSPACFAKSAPKDSYQAPRGRAPCMLRRLRT
jgi:hypothetical protein